MWFYVAGHGDRHLSAEVYYLVNESGELLVAAPSTREPLRTQIDVVHFVVHDVPVRDEDVMSRHSNDFEDSTSGTISGHSVQPSGFRCARGRVIPE